MSYTVTPTDMPIYFVIEKAKPIKLLMECAWSEYDQAKSVSYTHLTLPTKRIV